MLRKKNRILDNGTNFNYRYYGKKILFVAYNYQHNDNFMLVIVNVSHKQNYLAIFFMIQKRTIIIIICIWHVTLSYYSDMFNFILNNMYLVCYIILLFRYI